MNGTSGKKVDQATKDRAVELVRQGSTVAAVAERQRVSQSVIRNWIKAAKVTAPQAETAPKRVGTKKGSPWFRYQSNL